MQNELMGLVGSVLLAVACGKSNEPADGAAGSGDASSEMAGHSGSDAEQPALAGAGGARHAGAAGADSASGCQCTAYEQHAEWNDRSCICATAECPDAEEVLEPLDSCSGTPRIDDYGPVLRRGCGRLEYYRYAHGSNRFQFDALDGTSLAVQLGRDPAIGTCDGQQVAIYAWGEMMDLSTCADYSECTNCKTLTSESPSIPACTD